MLNTYKHQKALEYERIDSKSVEALFGHIIVQGTNCSPFESEVIIGKVKEVFRIGEHSEINALQPGQIIWNAVADSEPAGKPLNCCAKKRIVLTHIDTGGDIEVLKKYGHAAKRRVQIVRMSDEARQQEALLTQEDLGILLDCDSRTIRADIAGLKEEGVTVPTRGQQKDIGPGVTHKQQAVRFYLEGMEPVEIARRIKHSLKAVERYIDGYCRAVYCFGKEMDTFKTALLVGMSTTAVKDYLEVHKQYRGKKEYAKRAEMVAAKGRLYWVAQDGKKKPSRTRGLSK